MPSCYAALVKVVPAALYVVLQQRHENAGQADAEQWHDVERFIFPASVQLSKKPKDVIQVGVIRTLKTA